MFIKSKITADEFYSAVPLAVEKVLTKMGLKYHLNVSHDTYATAAINWWYSDYEQAYNINLIMPAMPLDKVLTRYELNCFAGYWIHELGHLLYTDKAVFDNAFSVSREFAYILNGLEDARIESKLIKSGVMPGAGTALSDLLDSLLNKQPTDYKWFNRASLPWLLAVCGRNRLYGVKHRAIPGVLPDVVETAMVMLESANSTQDCWTIAEFIMGELAKTTDDVPKLGNTSQGSNPDKGEGQDGGGQDGEGQDGEGQDGGGQDGEGQDGGGQEGEGQDGEGQEGQEGQEGEGQDGEGQDGEGQEGEGQDGEGQEGQEGQDGEGQEGEGQEGETSRNNAPTPTIEDTGDYSKNPDLSTSFKDFKRDLAKDFDSFACVDLTIQSALMSKNHGIAERPWTVKTLTSGLAKFKAQSALLRNSPTAQLRANIRMLLKSPAMRGKRHYQENGRLDMCALTRIKAGRTDVFSKKWEKPEQNTVLGILVDCSGSMKDYAYSRDNLTVCHLWQLSSIFARAIAESCHLSGAKFRLATYDSYYTPILDGTVTFNSKQGMARVGKALEDCMNSTNTMGAMLRMGHDLFSEFPNEKKLIMVLTDGAADGGDVLIQKTSRLIHRKYGIGSIGIGLGYDVSGQYDYSVMVKPEPGNLGAMLKALSDGIKKLI